MRKIKIGVVLIVLLTTSVFAWWSATVLFNSTHHKLTDSARNILDTTYPDVTTKFGGDVSNWTSGSTDDTRAHEGNSLANGGPIGDWWDKAQEEYKKGNFASGDWSAYYYVGLMMHLIEDQGVPAHAYDIPHGTLGHMDNMEQLAYYNYVPNITGIVNANSPISNYSSMQSYTLSATSNNYWRQYWNQGNYGWENGTDVFPTTWESAGESERNLTRQLLGMAVGYTAGALVAVSKSLPPLIKDLTISGSPSDSPGINTQTGNQISFMISENRKPNVKIFITVDSPSGQPIISSEYGTGKSFDLSSGTDLPYEGTHSVNWDGKLANGQYPSDGQHTLYVRVQDDDGNMSEDTLHPFIIDTVPSEVKVYDKGSGVEIAG
ncbi:MAG: hypothetical protein V1859_07865, partial [archaeon]